MDDVNNLGMNNKSRPYKLGADPTLSQLKPRPRGVCPTTPPIDMAQANLPPTCVNPPQDLSPGTIAATIRTADPDTMDQKGHKVPEFASTYFEH